MAATPDFMEKSPETIVAYLKVWLQAADDFKKNPEKVADVVYAFYTSKGYTMSKDTFKKAMATVDVAPGFPSDLEGYMTKHADALVKEKKIPSMPDMKKVMRKEFFEKAQAKA
jgi:ABC-type nitrate/sulfonate/bicarbonate transport system substrate-binding protein